MYVVVMVYRLYYNMDKNEIEIIRSALVALGCRPNKSRPIQSINNIEIDDRIGFRININWKTNEFRLFSEFITLY